MNRMISDQDRILGWNRWDVSKNIPGMTILKTLRVFHNITLALSKSDSGQYTIHRSVDYKKFELVHEHDTPIHGMFLIDSGIAAFSADDGWYVTEDAGTTWSEFPVEGAPLAEAAVAIRIPSDEEYDLVTYSKYDIVAYSIDRKLYYCEYPDGGCRRHLIQTIYTPENGMRPSMVPRWAFWPALETSCWHLPTWADLVRGMLKPLPAAL